MTRIIQSMVNVQTLHMFRTYLPFLDDRRKIEQRRMIKKQRIEERNRRYKEELERAQKRGKTKRPCTRCSKWFEIEPENFNHTGMLWLWDETQDSGAIFSKWGCQNCWDYCIECNNPKYNNNYDTCFKCNNKNTLQMDKHILGTCLVQSTL